MCGRITSPRKGGNGAERRNHLKPSKSNSLSSFLLSVLYLSLVGVTGRTDNRA